MAKRTHDPAKPGPMPGHCGQHVLRDSSDQAQSWSERYRARYSDAEFTTADLVWLI
jgi:hypothetical protein